METNLHLWILPALPLLGAAINGFFGKDRSRSVIGGVACTTVGLSFLYALALFFTASFSEHAHVETLGSWISAASFHAGMDFYLDPLSMLMVLVVTGVGLLIHIYSIGYMAHEDGYYRFFSFLNLFTFFMLTLVLAGNYLMMFVGWEGVGLCSYLLIGFYYLKKSAGDAGKKAFIVNRIGDFGFTLALLLIFGAAGSLDFGKVFAAFQNTSVESGMGPVTIICLLLFMGATGKSAQVPLYVWLPDAMEGPTPVSALIHAATMVTAGVYMVTRSSALFVKAPIAMETVAVVGAITCLFAATIAIAQNDIKKVLAYSTISQLGYMFLACGVGAFSSGIFHLMTHAFFKALLFLGAGSVITAMHHEQDMEKMGGLKDKIKITYWTMFAACLAIAGVPPCAGFFSKDEILWNAWSHGHPVLWFIGWLTAGLTAFYMFRLLFMTFWGAPQSDEASHAKESPAAMTWPLIALAVLSVIGGLVSLPFLMGKTATFEHFLEPSVAQMVTPEQSGELMMSILAVLAGLIGIGLACQLYLWSPGLPDRLAGRFAALRRVLANKYYVDEIYDALFVHSVNSISRELLWHVMDEGVIDGAANGLADGARVMGRPARRLQSGLIRNYAAWVVVGAVVVLFLMGVVWAK